MRSFASLRFILPALALGLATGAAPSDADACGACFHGEMENTQVTGHKMIFSISQTETTLWDQFDYMGDPTSFAWVLPVKGTVDVGLSSDALFENLNQQSAVQVAPPPLDCPPPPSCYFNNGVSGSSSGGVGGGTGGPVTVIAEAVVGPYETVTLHSSDPNALGDWLTTHGYVIPTGFAPVIGAYIAEGFDFLALRLIPGMGITSMKPVRVSTAGAGSSLPLRMIGAGVGVTTPITLWIFGEGRYQPTNFPTFTITEDQLVWDFAESSSNYAALRQQGIDATMGRGWLLETSVPFATFTLSGLLQQLAMYDPTNSGYADDMGNGATAALDADMAKLYGNLDPTALWLTRIHAELPRAALDADLDLGAAASQAQISANLNAKKGINIPACPTYPPCPDTASTSTGTGGAGTGGGGTGGVSGTPRGSSSGCSVDASPSDRARDAAASVLALSLGLALGRRRRRAPAR